MATNFPSYKTDSLHQVGRRRQGPEDVPPYGKARFPAYKTRAARIESFADWPKPQEMDPEELANAGFFYEGDGDKIQCFVCGAIFHNFDPLFSPKEEHAEYMRRCKYARLYKENPKVLAEVANLPAVRAVVQLGFPLPDVEKAYKQVRQTGNQSPNASDMLDVLWTAPKPMSLTNGNSPEDDTEEEHQEHEEQEEDLYSAGPSDTDPQACANYESDEEEEDDAPIIEIDVKKIHQEQAEGAKLRRKLEQLEHVGICRGCKEKKADTVNLPCGHIATCQSCVYKYNRCRICNTLIKGIVKIYMV